MKFWQSCFIPSSRREESGDRTRQTPRGALWLCWQPPNPGQGDPLPPQLFSICSISISPSSWKRLSAPAPPLRHAAPSSSFPPPSSSSSQERSSLLARCSSARERGGSGTGVQAGVLPGITSGERGAAVQGWGAGRRWEPSSAAALRQVRLLKVWRFCKDKGGKKQLRRAGTETRGNPEAASDEARVPQTCDPPIPADQLKHPTPGAEQLLQTPTSPWQLLRFSHP